MHAVSSVQHSKTQSRSHSEQVQRGTLLGVGDHHHDEEVRNRSEITGEPLAQGCLVRGIPVAAVLSFFSMYQPYVNRA